MAQHYPAFVAHLCEHGKALPAYVEKDFGCPCASMHPRLMGSLLHHDQYMVLADYRSYVSCQERVR